MWVQLWPHPVGREFGIAESCGIGCRCGSDPALLWLWQRLATAALIQPLAWKFPYAVGTALKRKKKKKEWDLDINYIITTYNAHLIEIVKYAFLRKVS